jgi:hypothetical protein
MTGATNLIIRDSSGVVVATILAAALTQDTNVPGVVSAYVTLGTFNAALTSGASLVLAATGTVTGSTYFDIAFNYAMV